METASQDALAALFAKETWSAEDHNQLANELFHTAEAPRKFKSMLADLESTNPQPKGQVALKIGIGRYMLGRPEQALAVLAEATDNKDRRYFQAMCYKALRRYAQAAEELDRAKARGGDAPAIDAQIVEALALQGDLDGARKALGKLQGKIQQADEFFLRGLIEDLSGNIEKAQQAYVQARTIDPSHYAATFRLAYFYDLHGEEEQAIALYKECLSHPPVNISTLLNLAVLYEDMGRYDKAVECLEAVLSNNPNNLRARLYLKDARASMTMYYDEEQAKRVARRNAVLDIPVTDFELSVRARNCLKKMNIRSLGDLVRTTEPDLLAYKNFGETSLKEIKDMLTAKGLHLGQALEENSEFSPTIVPPAAATAAAPSPAPTGEEGVLSTPIDKVEFSIRARRALQSLNIKVLGDLANKSEGELLTCRNFGQTSLNEIRQRLAEYGLQLREST